MRVKQTVGVSIAVMALVLSGAQIPTFAQSAGPLSPIGPIRQLPIPGARDASLEPSPLDFTQPQAQADTHTLSSIETLGIGSLGVVRNYLDPSFVFNQSLDNGIVPGTNNSVSSMGLNLAFNRNGPRSLLTGTYSGAHVLYSPSSLYDTTYHNLSVSQETSWARWVLRLHDDLSVSSETSFGGLDTAGIGAPITQQSSAGASDTIITQRGRRVNETAAAELDYLLSRRSTVTVDGAYTSLTFTNPGFINSRGANARIGYDYALAPKDSIGLMYTYSSTEFNTFFPSLQTDAVQLAYGRRVTGRIAFQVAAGPQLMLSGSARILNWSTSSAATYQTARAQYALTYAHGTFTGSGVFAGSQNHIVAGTVRYTLTRFWAASFGAGYAFNQALNPIPGINSSFGNWYGTTSISRQIGRHLQFGMNYRYQEGAAGSGACPVAACGSTQSRQVLGVVMQWHPWSIVQ